MKKTLLALLFAALLPFVACTPRLTRFQTDFDDVFDTFTVVTVYAKNEREFKVQAGAIYSEMLRLHRLFDIYNDYEGIKNLKTINDNAGIRPVQVDPAIMELLVLGKKAHEESGGAVNIAMGPVLRVWHDYRENASADPGRATIPPMDKLKDAAMLCDMDGVLIDEINGTVFLRDKGMSLDVGALAKGFAVQKAADCAEREAGFSVGLISAGGNVLAKGKPPDKDAWSVGIQDPDDTDGRLLDTVRANNLSLVTSGDYQRFYIAEGRRLHHIIDPGTLMPASRCRAVSVLHADSGTADLLSTALFILPYDEGEALLRRMGGDALWIFPDGTVKATDGYGVLSERFQRVTPQ